MVMNRVFEKRRIVVFEGPAGSGKSTRIRAGLQRGDWLEIQEPSRVLQALRDHGSEAHRTSLMKDHVRMMDIIGKGNDHDVYVLDRYLLSQMVYEAIRKDGFDYNRCNGIFRYNMLALHYTIKEYVARKYRTEGVDNFQIDMAFVVYLPSVTFLKTLRSRSPDRGYPFNPEDEILRYRHVSSILDGLIDDLSKDNIKLCQFTYYYGSDEGLAMAEFSQNDDLHDFFYPPVEAIDE